jgi:hypothetical protein
MECLESLKTEMCEYWKLKFENWKLGIYNMKLYDVDEIFKLVHKVFHYPFHIFNQIHLSKFVKMCEDDSHMWKQHERFTYVGSTET